MQKSIYFSNYQANLTARTTSQPSDMSGEGYKINLTQKDGKWIVDSSKSDSNYDYQALVSSFMGGLYE